MKLGTPDTLDLSPVGPQEQLGESRSISVSHSTFSVSLLGTQVQCYPELQPEFLLRIFSWGVRAPCLHSPIGKSLFWKKYSWEVHSAWALRHWKQPFLPMGSQGRLVPLEMKGIPFPKEPSWNQLGFPQQKAEKAFSTWPEWLLPAEGHAILGPTQNPGQSQEGTFWPSSDQWPSQGTWLTLTSIRSTGWLENRHKTTLPPSPDL